MGKRHGKKRRETQRKKGQFNEQKRVLIVTEGSKTEPNYFKCLREELRLINRVIIDGEGDPAPISVVEYAEALLRKDSDFDHVFLVFDHDRHDSYARALTKVEQINNNAPQNQTVKAITSIPCFEIWYLFHVKDSGKPYPIGSGSGSPADELISDLKASHPCFADYKKGECEKFYNEIKDMREDAFKRAEKYLIEGQKVLSRCHYENPSTRVHLVISTLQEMA
ncbi:MAG: RloB family protein [Paracoccaceae bacterium]|nr:RloB family protein [Paracoccaceae bacterium]MDE2916942.1 RloB family protein [Paracoccaceae bacterium]